MKVYSPVLKEKFLLKYVMPGAGGENVSPPIEWEGIPENTKSLVLVCVDIHPIARNWIHWCIINLPPTVKGLPEGASLKKIPPPAKELINSYGLKGYGGPQPPPGTGNHPYIFKLWALKISEVKIKEKPTYEEILSAVKPYVIGEAEFTVYFGR